MPCNDITDKLTITLDADDRIVRYSLTKRSCGGTVGQRSLIGGWLKNRPAAEVLSFTAEAFLKAHPTRSKTWQYLLLKHFLAVQSGLAILFGREPGGATDYCTAEAIAYGPEGMELTAQVHVKALTDQITACRSCCGAARQFTP